MTQKGNPCIGGTVAGASCVAGHYANASNTIAPLCAILSGAIPALQAAEYPILARHLFTDTNLEARP